MPTIVREGDMYGASNAALGKTLMSKPPTLLNASSRLVEQSGRSIRLSEEGCQQQFRIMLCLYRINVLD